MKLYLMRHGIAVGSFEWPGNENSRPLTKQGKSDLTHAAKSMKQSSFSVESVWVSPLTRAKETADILKHEMPHLTLLEVPALASGMRMRVFMDDLFPQIRKLSSVLLVGHLPDLCHVAAFVLDELNFFEEVMAPGEMWCLDLDVSKDEPPFGTLLWRRKTTDWKAVQPL